jgi:hypothetical protein
VRREHGIEFLSAWHTLKRWPPAQWKNERRTHFLKRIYPGEGFLYMPYQAHLFVKRYGVFFLYFHGLNKINVRMRVSQFPEISVHLIQAAHLPALAGVHLRCEVLHDLRPFTAFPYFPERQFVYIPERHLFYPKKGVARIDHAVSAYVRPERKSQAPFIRFGLGRLSMVFFLNMTLTLFLRTGSIYLPEKASRNSYFCPGVIGTEGCLDRVLQRDNPLPY